MRINGYYKSLELEGLEMFVGIGGKNVCEDGSGLVRCGSEWKKIGSLHVLL
jgi:hypothetical protein